MQGQVAEALKAPPANIIDTSMAYQKVYAPYKLATLVEALVEHGIPAQTVLAGTGLTVQLLGDPHVRTSVHDYVLACGNIIAAGVDPAIAFEVGSRLHLSAYGIYGYALICSPTVRDFFDFAVRYHPLATPVQRLGWRQEGNRAVWSFTEIYSDIMSPEVRAFLTRQQMMMALTHVRDVVGANLVPERALFALPDDGTQASDESRLGCPCLYDMPAHELHFSADFLDSAPQFGNRLTYAWLEETCEALIVETKGRPGLAGTIGELLIRASGQVPTMAEIAFQMGTTERTLRRRLEAENTRYTDIVDDFRRQITLRYIETTRMNADDIAACVGFSDTSNLRRAVKRWTGRTLGELRRG